MTRFRLAFVLLAAACFTATGCGDVDPGEDVIDVAEVRNFTIMTFNTGTTDNMDHTYDQDGWSNALADINTEQFGNNLAWLKARDGLRAVVDARKPDIITFQELFFDPECVEICGGLAGGPDFETVCDPAAGVFVCAKWVDAESPELTVRAAVGPDYDIACAPGHRDNCIAVRKGFGTIVLSVTAEEIGGAWIDGLDGMPPENGCTSGARVATGLVGITNGPEIAVVDVHTTAGTNVDCRLAQFQQVFEDRGDGKPATFGQYNIVLGDMNIDPFTFADASVTYWNSKVGEGKAFDYISSDSIEGPMTHPATFSKLDHVISDSMTGSCVVLGISEGTQAPISVTSTYFDHRPVFCEVEIP